MQDIDYSRVDLIIQFAALAAGQEDDWRQRELGRIHIVKYVYLADLEYAKYNQGETFTGIPWRFYKFGPWSEECFLRLEPALLDIGAQKREFSHPKYEDDFIRWSLRDPELYDKKYNQLPLSIAGKLQQAVRKFGSDTEGLLDYVYKTYPMLLAAPDEMLNFNVDRFLYKPEQQEAADEEPRKLTCRQEKKLKEMRIQVKSKIKEKLAERRLKERTRYRPPAPRYDETFFEGLKYLDTLAGEKLHPGEATGEIADNVWKSKARFDPELS